MMRAFSVCVLCTIGMSTLMTSCRRGGGGVSASEPASRPVKADDATGVRKYLESYIEIGENRPLTAGGPEFELPPSYFTFAREHPRVAMEILSEKLRSHDANVRANAYDFIGHLGDLPAYRERAIELLEAAERNEGFAIKETVRPFLQRLRAATQPATSQ